MNSSAWTILIIGVLALALIMVGMVYTLNAYQRSPGGNRTKLANEIQSAFPFEEVSVNYDKDAKGVRHLTIRYLTEQNTKFNKEVQEAEMRSVAIYAFQKTPEKERATIDEVRIQRTELHGSGCWESTYKGEYTMPIPKKEEKDR